MKSKSAPPLPPRPAVTCPRCHQLLKLKKPPGGFRCANGHEFPVEALLVLKARRLERLLREPQTSLERLKRRLDGDEAMSPAEDTSDASDDDDDAAASQVDGGRRTIDDDVVLRTLSAARETAIRVGARAASPRDRARRVECPDLSESDAPLLRVTLR